MSRAERVVSAPRPLPPPARPATPPSEGDNRRKEARRAPKIGEPSSIRFDGLFVAARPCRPLPAWPPHGLDHRERPAGEAVPAPGARGRPSPKKVARRRTGPAFRRPPVPLDDEVARSGDEVPIASIPPQIQPCASSARSPSPRRPRWVTRVAVDDRGRPTRHGGASRWRRRRSRPTLPSCRSTSASADRPSSHRS